MTERQDDALVQVIVSSGSSAKQIIGVEYKYSPIAIDKNATYPLRTTQTAWQQLQPERVLSLKWLGERRRRWSGTLKWLIMIRPTPQEFFQPVYVFKGDNGFKPMFRLLIRSG